MATDADLFDRLQKRFGYGGDFDSAKTPWYKHRAAEIAKLKRIRTARKGDVDELMVAVDYAIAKGIYVHTVFDLFEHLSDALHWQREKERIESTRGLEDQIAEAIQIESEFPGSPWAERLIRAAGPAREEVYREWETSFRSRGGRA